MPTLLHTMATALADRYRVERELGRGGMATVFLAEDLKHGRLVAIKVLNPEVAAEIGPARFLREIEIVARLTHPHILPLHDSGEARGELYFVTPYIEGESLRARLDREGRLPVEEALRLTREIANGLGHAHHRGLVHRDVKPENVLLSDGIALVADFGIARLSDAPGAGPAGRPRDLPPGTGIAWTGATPTEGGGTRLGAVAGTPLYMAPEQAQGGVAVDARADIYALGCVLYEMLAGQPPFTGPTREGLLYQHQAVAPRAITELRSDVSPGLAAVLARALAKAPEDRYATAARFADALGVATAEMPVPAAAGSVPNNLPRERTSFVGRETALEECSRLLAEARLLTIVGVGGCGKTRLALKLAESQLESHPGGVWFADLAPVPSPERIAPSVAATLAIQEEPGVPLTTTIAHRLGGRQVLLVLDNCEHLLSACADFADALLTACRGLRVVATSREALGVAGERLHALRTLSVPGTAAGGAPSEIEASEAVRLFVDRARAAIPEFALNAESAPAIAEICRRLDGIPLAIELAAARTKVLSLAQICDKLNDRFRLLTGGNRALPRHQTLRATIQWSYDHLGVELKRVFERLAVFAGGCTLEAAAGVMGEGLDEFEVLDAMTGLVDKSLVVVGREGERPRYRMLETIRQFAEERLSESGTGDEARGRHLEFHLGLVEDAETHLHGHRQGEWFRRLDQDMENILAAHDWCDRAEGGAEKGLRLAGAMRLFWIVRGHFELGLRTTRQALGREGAGSPTVARGRALLSGGLLAHRVGDQESARALLEESISIAHAVDDTAGAARALNFLGIVTFTRGDARAAHGYLEGAIAIAEGVDKASALNTIATILNVEGDARQAVQLYEEGLALARTLGSHSHEAAILENLSMARIVLEEYAEARVSALEALELGESVALIATRQGVLEIVSLLAAAGGEPERAARLWGAADALLQRIGGQRSTLKDRVMMPLITRTREVLGEEAFAVAYAAGLALPDDAAAAEGMAWLREVGSRV